MSLLNQTTYIGDRFRVELRGNNKIHIGVIFSRGYYSETLLEKSYFHQPDFDYYWEKIEYADYVFQQVVAKIQNHIAKLPADTQYAIY